MEAELQNLWGKTVKDNPELPPSGTDESLERLYSTFMRDVLLVVDYEGLIFESSRDIDPFDAVVTSRQHAELVYGLIKSDVQNRSDDDDELRLVMKKEFPPTYRRALQFISEVLETIKAHNEFSPLYSVIKFIPRKEGLRLNVDSLEAMMSVREIVEVKRKVERSLSSILLLCITFRSVYNTPGAKEDFMYFAKGMAERLPVQDKHFALLLFCRGILQPAYAATTDQTHENGLQDEYKLDVQGLTRAPLMSLRHSFVNGMKAAGAGQPSAASRMLFPFAALALRGYHAVADNEPFTAADESEDLFGNDLAAVDAEEGGEEGSKLSRAMYSLDELRLCEMFRVCADIDVAAHRSRGLEDMGAELLSSLQRWLTELTAVHFINNEDLQLRAETLPEEIARNTVAMELLATSGTFVLGKKKQRVAYMAHTAEVGRKLQIAMDAFEGWRTPDDGSREGIDLDIDLSDGSDGSAGYAVRELDDDIDRDSSVPLQDRQGGAFGSPVYEAMLHAEFTGVSARHPLANTKKWMAIVNILSFLLPKGHPLGHRLDAGLRLSILGENARGKADAKTVTLLHEIVEGKMHKMRRKVTALHALGGHQEGTRSSGVSGARGDGEGLWASSRHSSGASPGVRAGKRDTTDKRAFWYPSSAKEEGRRGEDEGDDAEDEAAFWTSVSLRGRHKSNPVPSVIVSGTPTLPKVIDSFLLRSVAPILGIDLSNTAHVEQASHELSYLFMRWRNPVLLFDYYRVHNTAFTKDVHAPYRRFLRGLLGASEETTDQIRICDPCNRRHLERFPPEVIRPWIEGRTASGEVLPGYSDPQTLFMLGEDAQSCMMVKPRQRNTNRALLSFLLHGNVRVLGAKDSSGKLRTRAVVKLLEDKDTRRPILYVESPVHVGGGGPDAVLEVYDQAAELGSALGLPVVYTVAPDANKYYMSGTELAAASLSPEYFALAEEKGEKVEADSLLLRRQDFSWLVDHSSMAPYVWVDGLRDPLTGRFIDGMTPILYKRCEVGEPSPSSGASDQPDPSQEATMGAEEASSTDLDYYTNGFRLPGTIENLYSREAERGAYLPDYTCGPGKSSAYFDSMAWSMPVEVSRQTARRGVGTSADNPYGTRVSGRGEKKKISMQEMLVERQKRINALSGRADRVEKEKQETRDQREKIRQGLELNSHGDVVQTDDAKLEAVRDENIAPTQEVPLAEEEGAGIFDDTDDLW